MQDINNYHCFTIGHSNHPIEKFLDLLKKYDIDHVIDIRSNPFSKYQPQYNENNLKDLLSAKNIRYLFFGDKLGGRYKDSKYLYPDGTVDYNKVRKRPEFLEGIQEIEHMMKGGKSPVLLCSEKDPFDCHRFVLVSKNISNDGFSVHHILQDGTTISNSDLERKLQDHYHNYSTDLESLYEQRNKDIMHKVQASKIDLIRKKGLKKSHDIQLTDEHFQPTVRSSNMPDEKITVPDVSSSINESIQPYDNPQPVISSQKRMRKKGSFKIDETSSEGTIRVFTIGFTKKSATKFFETLSNNDIRLLIDIRLNNKSQLAGFTKEEDLKYFLKKICDIDYLHMEICAPSEELLKKYQKKEITWKEYEKEYRNLLKNREIIVKFDKNKLKDVCFLCSEPKPDQCHRRLLTEYLQKNLPDLDVIHL